MRRSAALAVFALILLAACSSNGSDKASTTSSDPASSTSAPVTSSTVSPSSTVAPASSTTGGTPTTAQACSSPESSDPFSTPPAATSANVLTGVRVAGGTCSDVVTFSFRSNKGAPPQCKVSYQPGPFTEDASGKPVTVAGSAFLVVRCEPARSYDLLTGKTTYTVPPSKHTAVTGAQRVRDLAATGDFEGVMSWAIGVDGQHAFQAHATPGGALVVNVY